MKHENCVKVLDGRALLHRVQWTKKKRSPISWKDTILISEIRLEMDPMILSCSMDMVRTLPKIIATKNGRQLHRYN